MAGQTVANPYAAYTLINSVDFHPDHDTLCATYTTTNRVVLFAAPEAGPIEQLQQVRNPLGRLRSPQHATYSADGAHLYVANWSDQRIGVYRCKGDGTVRPWPTSLQSQPQALRGLQPHGLAAAPNGMDLAIAYGYTRTAGRAVAVVRPGPNGLVLRGQAAADELPGIPKGIAVSPDGSCLAVTFCDDDGIGIFPVDPTSGRLGPRSQWVPGAQAGIAHSEGVTFDPSGTSILVTNSKANTVTRHAFDRSSNRLRNVGPTILFGPDAPLAFPHGIAVTRDGHRVAVSEFGPRGTTHDGDVIFDAATPAQDARIRVFKTA